MRIVLDPGHGGSQDRGAKVGPIHEAELNLSLAQEVALSFHGLPNEVKVELTRYSDEAVSFEGRGAAAAGADLLISIHCNAHRSGRVKGVEVYTWPDSLRGRNIGRIIAGKMPHELLPVKLFKATDLDTHRDDWLQRPRRVLEEHWHEGTPALLLECGYMSNDGDLQLLTSAGGRGMIASAIRAGICRLLFAQGDKGEPIVAE